MTRASTSTSGPPNRHPDPTGRHELVERRGEPVASGQRVEMAAGDLVLRGGPGPGARVVGVLEPAVGVGDGAAVQLVDDVQALGPGVGGSGGHVGRG